MIAALYARKSTEQQDRAEDAKSVARQVEQARAFAEARGWTVSDTHIYVDDGISGAEFERRPAFQALLAALAPRPPFQVLVMSEASRLGREAIETMHTLKRLMQAGVRVFHYLDGREVVLGTMGDNLAAYVQGEASAEERRRASQRVHAAFTHKAQRGHVVGGRCFGYRNVDVHAGLDKDGRPIRSHVVREIHPEEAAVVRQIFEAYAHGDGKTTIAKTLNAQGAPSPRAQQGRPSGWSPSSVHEVLYRETYRGVVVWNKSRKRDAWGQHRQTARPAEDHLTVEAPELRIIDDALWAAVQARQETNRSRYLRATNGLLYGRPRDRESPYLLSGFLRCGHCGASWAPVSRQHGTRRAHFYACFAHHKRGSAICQCGVTMPMAAVDEAVRRRVRTVLSPAVVRRAVDAALEELLRDDQAERRAQVTRELAQVQEAQQRLVTAITSAGDVLSLTEALKASEARRLALVAEQQALTAARPALDVHRVRAKAEAAAADLSRFVDMDVAQQRQIFRKVLKTPIFVRANADGTGVQLTGAISLSGVVPPIVASPAGFEPAFQP